MKICTITCHDVYNHGASLQAYALMSYLESQGHQVNIIDYKPDYLSNHYQFFSIDNPQWERNFFSKMVYLAIKIPIRIWAYQRKVNFDKFRRQYLKLTPTKYKTYQALREQTPSADMYICGSDQIWNTLHKNGKDPAFYLAFVDNPAQKIAYAASLATDKIYDDYEDFVIKNVNQIKHVGVREKKGVQLLQRLGVTHAKHVMDPVFLLSKADWDKLATGNFRHQPYILVYDFDNDELVQALALKLAQQKDCKIYAVNLGAYRYADKTFRYVGPDVFIALIRDASAVISNSFHAIVLSLIYGTEFYLTTRKESINVRMLDLLESMNMTHRLIKHVNELDNHLQMAHDLPSYQARLEVLIEQSKSFLSTALQSRL